MDHSTVTRTMTRYTSIAALLFAGLLSACGKKEVQDLVGTAPQARIRFFNFGVNAPSVNFYANPMTLFAKNTTTATETAIGAEVAYKAAGAFVTLPAGAYDLSTRYTGSATNVLTRPGVSFNGGRVYTITARGDITVAPTTTCGSTNKTCLDNTANR